MTRARSSTSGGTRSGNYITALGYGTDAAGYRRWWAGADRRMHLVGKGVLRFHAVYWPAILLSAGLPLPTDILVHDYLTIDGAQDQQVRGQRRPPIRPRWPASSAPTRSAGGCCARCRGSVTPTSPPARLIARANDDLANGLGNLVSRVITLVHRYRQGQRASAARARARRVTGAGPLRRRVPARAGPGRRGAGRLRLPRRHRGDLGRRRRGEPLHRAGRALAAGPAPSAAATPARDEQLDAALGVLIAACRTLAAELAPFLPGLAARVARVRRLGRLPEPRSLFPRIGVS